MAAESALFVVAASSKLARGRAERLVVKGLGVDTSGLPPDVSAFVEAGLQADGRFHAWSIRDTPSLVGFWRRANPGDWMVFYEMGFFAIAARVAGCIEAPALAQRMWGSAEAEELRFIVSFDQSYPIWAKVWKHREELGARFLGFRRVAEDRQAVLRARYGSIDNFVTQELTSQPRSPR